MMRVLLTGATGGLGRYVLNALYPQHEVVVLSRHPRPREFAGQRWIVGDVTDPDACAEALGGVSAVQHLAALRWPTDLPEFAQLTAAHGLDHGATFRVNMLGLYSLVAAAVDAGVQTFVFAGSNCALGHGFRRNGSPFPFDHLPVDESHPSDVEDTYSYTKLVGEELLAMFSRAHGMRTYVTRIAAIMSPAQREQHASTVQTARGWDPWLWSWVASEDVARAHVAIMENAASLPRHAVYYLNADDTLALEPTAKLLRDFRPDLATKSAGVEGNGSLFSNAKLRDATGWRPRITWRNQL